MKAPKIKQKNFNDLGKVSVKIKELANDLR